jgi:hypothetical protein
MSRGGGEIQPGTRQYSTDASFPATPAASSMPAWYPQLLASVIRQVSTGRSKAITISLPSIRELEAELPQGISK